MCELDVIIFPIAHRTIVLAAGRAAENEESANRAWRTLLIHGFAERGSRRFGRSHSGATPERDATTLWTSLAARRCPRSSKGRMNRFETNARWTLDSVTHSRTPS